jgi:glycosyltransferase involved in cell wall biosynthesis
VKIAYFSPLPPDRTGIADYSAMLLPALAQAAELTLYTNQPKNVIDSLAAQFSIQSVNQFPGSLKAGVDICLYQMGNNSQYHQAIYQMMRQYPGVVTLHDVNLHSFYGDLYLKSGRVADYCREMAFNEGDVGIEHARGGLRGKHPYGVQQFPLFGRVVEGNLGIVVHSQYASNQIRASHPDAAVRVIPIVQNVLDTSPQISTAAAKAQLGFAPETVLLASFGYVASNKRIDVVLRAFARLNGRFPHCRLALVGQVVEGYNLEPLLAELNLNNSKVRLVGFADSDTFAKYIAACDIGLNLRYPTLGESSATLLRLLAMGKPVLVSDVDSFAELPETAVIKIAVGQEEQAQIETELTALITDETVRQTIGSQAAKHVREQHIPDLAAQHYVEFLQEVIGGG